MISIVADRLCGSIPITTSLIRSSQSPLQYAEPGGHRYFEQGKPL
jgi:hypothetical protein